MKAERYKEREGRERGGRKTGRMINEGRGYRNKGRKMKEERYKGREAEREAGREAEREREAGRTIYK